MPARPRTRLSGPALVCLACLVLLTAWYAPGWQARWPGSQADSPAIAPRDALTARFGSCFSGGGTNCVVDGDTFWFDGRKIRIADIDTPETHGPRCPAEGALGIRATDRLQTLMNAGAFTLESVDRDTDRYGRLLRVVKRNGRSIGAQLVSEGLAREWDGRRHPWC